MDLRKNSDELAKMKMQEINLNLMDFFSYRPIFSLLSIYRSVYLRVQLLSEQINFKIDLKHKLNLSR